MIKYDILFIQRKEKRGEAQKRFDFLKKCANIKMTIEIKKDTIKDGKVRCKCGRFLFKTSKSGYIHFSTGVQMSLDGLEIKVKCTCGKITQVKIKNTIECAD